MYKEKSIKVETYWEATWEVAGLAASEAPGRHW